jgi:hypothetical protein
MSDLSAEVVVTLVEEFLRSSSSQDVNDTVPDSAVENTLLHLAVEHSLPDCVVKLLAAGARTDIRNAQGLAPFDIALAAGEQILGKILQRNDCYRERIELARMFRWEMVTMQSNGDRQKIFDQLRDHKDTHFGISMGHIYEDYFDWDSAENLERLKVSKWLAVTPFKRFFV